VVPLSTLAGRLRSDATIWRELRIGELVFNQRTHAMTALLVLTGLAFAVLLWRWAASRVPGRRAIVVPALVGRTASSRWHAIRHVPSMVALAGLPFLAIAIADPLTTVSQDVVSYPGRRIALLIDASSSMMVPFASERLRDSSRNEAAFLTTIAAADVFVRQRRAGRYRDFIAVVEFGDEAYVVTPFTTDYDNALLSISLIGDWNEYMKFPDSGTAIERAIDQATGLFKAFDFLNAAGNAMVIFSDGQDTQVTSRGKSLAQVLASASGAHIPVYLVRTSSGKQLGDIVPDAIWRPAVEATGGRFYAAATEADVLRAIRDIDVRSQGTIDVKVYTMREPRFAIFALIAVMFWVIALALNVMMPFFSKFP
jgi:hypothetical protein